MPEEYTGFKQSAGVAGFGPGSLNGYIRKICESRTSTPLKAKTMRSKRRDAAANLHKFGCYTKIGDVTRELMPSEVATKIGKIEDAFNDGITVDEKKYAFYRATLLYVSKTSKMKKGKPIYIRWSAMQNINAICRIIDQHKATR